MSSIYKLSIRGVRSFDPDATETIQFGFPLTLICGQNGSGKTTIIECLKYATTGDLPPNSKGGAFIHDPKITGEREVRAQVKLAFSNANGASMISTRTMQLLMKKTSSTFKTLEGQLAVMNKGERTTVSTKCAELDVQIPLYLGVSKSILDYVIFCHQEDSLWPLSEPSLLKKRFDEIFEALKFTKVLDDLKVIRKDMAVDLKVLQQSVNHLRTDKDRAKKINERIVKINNDIDDYKVEIDEMSLKLTDLSEKSNKLFKSNQEFQQVLSKVENLKNSKVSLTEQIKRLSESITLLNDTDDELSNQYSNFDSINTSNSEKLANLKEDQTGSKNAIRDVRGELNNAIRMEGQYKVKEEKYKKDVEARKILIEDNKSQFGLHFTELNDTNVAQFRGTVKSQLTINIKKTDELKSKNRATENDLENALKVINDSKTREEQHKIYSTQDIEKFEKDIKLLNSKIDTLQFNEGNIEYEKSQLDEMLKKFGALKESKEIESVLSIINEKNSSLWALENEIEDLNKKAYLSNKQSDIHAKISLLKEDKVHRENAIASMIQFNSRAFEECTGGKINLNTCEGVLNEKIADCQQQVKDQQFVTNEASYSLSQIEMNLKHNEDKLDSLTEEMRTSQEKADSILPEDVELDDYESFVSNLEEDYQIALENMKLQNMTKDFNVKALEIAEREKKCVLCRRAFSSDQLSVFLALLEKQTARISQQELQEEYERTKSDLAVARSLSSSVENIRKLKISINTLEEEKKTLLPKFSSAKELVSETKEELKSIMAVLSSIESLRNPLGEIMRMEQELNNIEIQIGSLEDELQDFGVSISTTELQELQEEKNHEVKELRKTINQLVEKKDMKQKEYSRLENNIKDKKLSISNLERSSIEKKNYLKAIEENTNNVSDLKSSISQMDTILKDLTAKYSTLEAKYTELKNNNKRDESNQEKRAQSIKDLHTQFEILEGSISYYLDYVLDDLALNHKYIVRLEKEISTFESEMQSNEKAIRVLEKSITEASNIQHNIRHNLEFRQMQNEVAEYDMQIRELDVQNAESERDRYLEETKQIRDQYSELTARHAGKRGEKKQMEDQVRALQNELGTEYKNIGQDYHREWVKLQTNILVSNDLATYSKALDNAIMKYHSVKMEEINKIVDELWKKTYSGTDVDTILIRSDVNVQAKGNRSYNYRVVMVKQGVELDMRGRCSAGQKVLASIIIRLALAECFGVNCGMIALDEPTTNLDIDNIESLARSLNNIIDMRKSQKNFQLIVITHDEKFLNHINGDQFTDHFYRVQRNERQKSQIRSLPIALIHEE